MPGNGTFPIEKPRSSVGYGVNNGLEGASCVAATWISIPVVSGELPEYFESLAESWGQQPVLRRGIARLLNFEIKLKTKCVWICRSVNFYGLVSILAYPVGVSRTIPLHQ